MNCAERVWLNFIEETRGGVSLGILWIWKFGKEECEKKNRACEKWIQRGQGWWKGWYMSMWSDGYFANSICEFYPCLFLLNPFKSLRVARHVSLKNPKGFSKLLYFICSTKKVASVWFTYFLEQVDPFLSKSSQRLFS